MGTRLLHGEHRRIILAAGRIGVRKVNPALAERGRSEFKERPARGEGVAEYPSPNEATEWARIIWA